MLKTLLVISVLVCALGSTLTAQERADDAAATNVRNLKVIGDKPEDYSYAESLQAARLSFAAYCKVTKKFSCAWCKEALKADPSLKLVDDFGYFNSAYFGFVAYSPAKRRVYTVFRGTDNANGWKANLRARLIEPKDWKALESCPISGGRVHRGFYLMMRKHFESREAADGEQFVPDPWYRVYLEGVRLCRESNGGADCEASVFTGHSLGGGLATIAAWTAEDIARRDWKALQAGVDTMARTGVTDSPFDRIMAQVQKLPNLFNSKGIVKLPNSEDHCWAPPARLLTFGSPRVGNSVFARCFALQAIPSYRHTFFSDPVTHLPQTPLGFRHVGREVYFPTAEEVRFCNEGAPDDQDSKCSSEAPWERALLFMRFGDHSRALWLHSDDNQACGVPELTTPDVSLAEQARRASESMVAIRDGSRVNQVLPRVSPSSSTTKPAGEPWWKFW